MFHRQSLGAALACAGLLGCTNAPAIGDVVEPSQDETDKAPEAKPEERPPVVTPPAGAVVTRLALSADGDDRLSGVALDDAGNVYASGSLANVRGEGADTASVVVKLDATGALDATFGDGGKAVHNFAIGAGGETARAIALQSDGKIVVAGNLEHAAGDVRDRDLYVARLDVDGSLDPSFGDAGIAIVDLSEGKIVGDRFVADSQFGLNIFADGALLVTGAMVRDGATDTDFALVRLSKDGVRDDTFGKDGVVSLDIDGASASARTATILPDGNVLMTGYTRIGSVVQPVVFKVDATGALVPSFGDNGIFSEPVLASITEVYGAQLQGEKLVTTGYGRNAPSESLDWLSLRLDVDGTLDKSWGEDGVVRLDLAGFDDNSRALHVLADDRVLLLGGGRTTADDVDGMAAVLTRDGAVDETFGTGGIALFDFGGPDDFLTGVAVSGDGARAAFVGHRGAANDDDDDDAMLVLQPL